MESYLDFIFLSLSAVRLWRKWHQRPAGGPISCVEWRFRHWQPLPYPR